MVVVESKSDQGKFKRVCKDCPFDEKRKVQGLSIQQTRALLAENS